MNNVLVKSFALICFSVFALFANAAEKPFNAKKGLAVSGYDTVAYFTQDKAVKGSKSIVAEYNGATWRFSSEEHKSLFVANPGKYAPQYGGYCAFAMANDNIAPVDPEAYTIVDGKLYLNYNKKVRAKWKKDIPGYLADSEVFWAKK